MIEAQETLQRDPRAFTTQVRVRYPECDPMGYAHHATWLIWFELARVELLRSWGLSHAEMEASGAPMVVARMEVAYKAPARYDEALEVEARLERWTAARVVIRHEARRAGTLLCTATATICSVRADGRPQRLPASLQAALEAIPRSEGE